MGVTVLQWLAMAAFTISSPPGGPAQPQAAAVEVDFATATEAVVGKDRVVLLSVTRFTEFVSGDAGKGPRAVTSLRVMCLREWLGKQEPGTVLTASEVDVFAAGTAEKPAQFAGNFHNTLRSGKNYGGYADWLKRQDDEWSVAKLPAVKDANLATVEGVTFQDVRVTAKKADVRVKVGGGVVVFRNVPLE